MASVLLTQEAFDNLLDHVQPDQGESYLIDLKEPVLIEDIGEVNIVEVWLTTEVRPGAGVPSSFLEDDEEAECCDDCR